MALLYRDSERLTGLADQAKMWYSTLSDFVFRHITIQVLVLGWALASENAGARVAGFPLGWRLAFVLLPIAYSLMVFVIFRTIAMKSAQVMSDVQGLDEQAYCDLQNYAIDRRFWLGMAAVHMALSVLIVVLLLVE